MSFAVWLTGLSGCGKSSIARELAALLHGRGVDAAVLESDAMRTQLTPFPRYDERERDFFYAALRRARRVRGGRGRAGDLRRHRQPPRLPRRGARRRIPKFAEVFVDTPLEVCAARDPKGLYRAAREGKSSTLPGLQAAYEAPLSPELTLHGDRGTPLEAAKSIAAFLAARHWIR